jgi:hypothetical protein
VSTPLMDVRETLMVVREPYTNRLPGKGRAKGAASTIFGCEGGRTTTQGLGRGRAKFGDHSGRAVIAKRVDASRSCSFFFTGTSFSGNQKQPEGSTITSSLSVQALPEGADSDCFKAKTLCLNGGRFKVEVDWRNQDGLQGQGMGFPQTDDSGTLYFFDPDDTELVVKVLNGCGTNGNYWVVVKGVTSAESTVKVTDTETSIVKSYLNPLGQDAVPVLDTSAFATCP